MAFWKIFLGWLVGISLGVGISSYIGVFLPATNTYTSYYEVSIQYDEFPGRCIAHRQPGESSDAIEKWMHVVDGLAMKFVFTHHDWKVYTNDEVYNNVGLDKREYDFILCYKIE